MRRFRWDDRARCGIRGQLQEAGNDMKPSRDISGLIEVMAALRTPVTGCEWDREQSFATIAPYTIEEAYEVADAIARDDMDALADELGDLQLQVVFHAQMAAEAGHFDLDDVIGRICDKLERRHPHIFSCATHSPGWEELKAAERSTS